MAAKRFHIATPEELRQLSAFVKDGKLDAMIRVWTVTIRKQGKSRWDDAIYISFSGDRNRIAEVFRIDASGEVIRCASMRYNKALNWCEQHLQEAFIS